MSSSNWRGFSVSAIAGAALGGLVPISVAQTTAPGGMGGVEEVIVTAPGGSAGVEISRYPGNAQMATDQELAESGAINLTEFLSRGLGSVHINDAQNNPYQPEFFYRGFGSSSLLGFPQGIAIYADGVRRNELFGDVVNWDTIPDSAVANVQLIPGSNPLFGLNTLGGAVAMETKNGFTHPGTAYDLFGGSFGRFNGQVETGGNREGIGWFFTVEGFTEDGWRDFSDSDLVQAFGKVSWRGDAYETDVSLTLADSDLRGNGAAPVELLDNEGREAVFTFPDRTENEMVQIHARTSWFVDETTTVTGGLYYRRTDTDTFNGDGSDFDECQEPGREGLVCQQDGDEEELALDQRGNPISFSDAVEGGTENSSATRQDAFGGSLQAVFDRVIGGKRHQVLVGGSFDYGDIEFRQSTELATLTAQRGTAGSGFIVDDSITDVDTEITHGSLFASDTIGWTDRFDLTLSARFNHADIEIDDQLTGDGQADDDRSLTGDHAFKRLNPAIGLTYQARDDMSLFGAVSESNRAPTPAELTCANPDDPCRLPNAFVDDPPLDQVVTRTFEVGARGDWGDTHAWRVAAFHSESRDDILFISAGSTTAEGFFDNVGKTRRMGIEFGLDADLGRLRYALNYTYVNAEFRDAFLVNSPNHPLRDPADDELPALSALQVQAGDRIPGIPEHLFRFNASYDVSEKFTIGSTILGQSDQLFRGDESNSADELDGFVLVNMNASYRITRSAQVYLRVNNLFDSEYETFGVFGEATEVLGEEFEGVRRFIGSGAPIGAWVGVRARF